MTIAKSAAVSAWMAVVSNVSTDVSAAHRDPGAAEDDALCAAPDEAAPRNSARSASKLSELDQAERADTAGSDEGETGQDAEPAVFGFRPLAAARSSQHIEIAHGT